MKHVYLVLLISVFVVGSAFAGIPDDKDLLLWIGEGSGHTAVDGTGNGNDGTFHGNAKWVGDGKYQAGISLIGAETYMEVPNVLAEAGSLLFWFKPDWNGKDGDDYRIFDASHGPIYFFISKGANHFDFNPEDFGFYFEAADDADWRDVKYPAGVITKDKWFHVAATWNFDGGNPFLYIDGKEAATSRKKITGGFPKLHPKPRFGWETVPYIPLQNGAEGVIDEISFWQRALEENEIQEMMDISLDAEESGNLAVTWGELIENGIVGDSRAEEEAVIEPGYLAEDVNDDGVVNIQDLVLVSSNFGKQGENKGDINDDGVVDIVDLVKVAAAFGNAAAAPSVHLQTLDTLTTADIQSWLTQAQQHLNLTDVASQRGIRFLEQLLAVLTPKQTVLLPNYPNPFNPETWIPYQLANPSDVQIFIYDTRGIITRRLALGHQPQGYYTTRSRAAYWDGRNSLGEPVASGVYFYRLETDRTSGLKKMVILK